MHGVRVAAIVALGLAAAACGGGSGSGGGTGDTGGVPTPKSQLVLKNFSAADNCAEFRQYAADALTEQYLQPFYRCLGGPLVACPVYLGPPVPVAAPGSATGGAQGSPPPARVSGTNTQEPGVDEADIVKADSAGNIYILSGKHLFVLAAFPPAGLPDRPLADLDLGKGDANFYAGDFFLDEAARRVVVMGESYASQGGEAVDVIVDVSDPGNPVEARRLSSDGYGLEARRIGARVHRVSRFDVPLPAWFYDGADPLSQKRQDYQAARDRGDPAAMAAIKSATRDEIGRRVDAAGADALLPRLHDGAAASALACSAVARPEVPEGLGLALIDSFDSDGGNRATSAAINNAWLVYASADNLYLAQSSFGWRFDDAQAEETAIYRFALGSSGAAAYQGVGKVPGSIGGAYAMSQSGGNLRVASTQTRFAAKPGSGSITTYNQLDVLRADQPGLDMSVIGSVADFAPGERIQGVRFVGSRGYVVTFRQIDPLFAFDLADPAHPFAASELKIPGFSSYLAPIGDDYLLTVGREGGDQGTLSGRMQISLFDVRDLANVRQVATLVPSHQPGNSYSYSSAEYDPHAFTYFPDRADAPSPGTLALPLQTFGETADEQFAGFLVVRVNAVPAQSTGPVAPLAELGRVDHSGLAADRFCGGGTTPPGGPPAAPGCAPGVYAADPRRAVFMQDAGGAIDLFTISLVGVIAVDAAAPADELGRRTLPFDPPPYDYCCATVGGGTVTPSGP